MTPEWQKYWKESLEYWSVLVITGALKFIFWPAMLMAVATEHYNSDFLERGLRSAAIVSAEFAWLAILGAALVITLQ